MDKDWSDDFVYHWQHYLVPARASPSDLDFMQKKISEKGKRCRILILGSTPEYRNLCGEMGLKAVIMDFKRKNYEYLRNEVKNLPEESFHQADWLDSPLKEKFDIILGDNVINVVAREKCMALLQNVSGMLKDNGFFMPRSYIRDASERYTPEKVIAEYRQRRVKVSLYTGTNRGLYLAAYNFRKHRLLLDDVWKVIVYLHGKKIITDDELEEYRKCSFEKREFQFYIPEKAELSNLLENYFDILDTFYGDEPYLEDKFPVHLLRKKPDIATSGIAREKQTQGR